MRLPLVPFSALTTLTTIVCAIPLAATAQIVPDRTLGNENSVVVPNQNIRGINSDRIDGGAVRGSNLFHSFQEFNIDEGRGAYFSNPDNIVNILTRVTGGNISQILGTLGVLGDANFFLINPNGIVFGPNARLDVGGSFFASTADGILFENGFEFAASNPEAPPLLTINMPLGLNIRENPGAIVNQTVSPLVDVDGNIPPATPSGLYVPPEETIAFIGGEVRFESGVIASPGSRIELGGLSEPGIVELNSDGSFSFPTNTQRADVLLTNGALATVIGNPGGNITINARNIEISGESQVANGVAEVSSLLNVEDGENFETEPSQAGDIRINATESVILTDQNSAIGNLVFPNTLGNAGNIDIQTNILSISDGAQILTSTFGNGDGGNLTVTATDVELVGGGSQLGASVEQGATGNGGTLTVNTQNLSVREGAQIQAATFGNGDGGDLTITANNVELVDTGVLGVSVEQRATGNGGTLTIDTQNLSVQNGAQISASTFSSGNAGNVTIRAEKIELIGARGEFPSSISSDVQETPDGLRAEGNGGEVFVEAQQLSISKGAGISASTRGFGDAGNVVVNATEVTVSGESSSISSQVNQRGTGNGGTVTINTQNLLVQDKGVISASTLGSGSGGTLTINTGRLTVQNGSQIQAVTTGSGQGGIVNIIASESVEVTNAISSSEDDLIDTAITTATPGNANGGNLTIITDELILQNGGQVSTSTFGNGDAGNLTVRATNIELIGEFKIEGQAASSALFSESIGEGRAGNISIETGRLTLQNGAQINSQAEALGNAGNIRIVAEQSILQNGSTISSSTRSSGNAGNLSINAEQLILQNQSQINAATNGIGEGGMLRINTEQLFVQNGSAITSVASGSGQAGTLNIIASDFIAVSGDPDGQISAITTQTRELNNAKAGNLIIQTPNLILQNGGQITTSTFGNGDAGNLTVRANNINLIGESADGVFPSALQSNVEELVFNGELQEGVGASGNAGEILVEAQQLTIRDGGEIAASTRGSGNAGNLTVRAADIRLMGESSGIASQSNLGTTGNGGNIVVESQQLLIQDGGQVSASTLGEGRGGTVTITTENLRLEGGSSVITDTIGTGRGGTVTIITENLRLEGGSSVTADTIGTGRGGQLNVRASESIELRGSSAEGEPSNLSTSSSGLLVLEGDAGDAGDVIVTTEKLVVQDGALIGASSRLGGSVTINQITIEGGGQPASAGNVQVTAPIILLDNQASLRAETTAGEQGNIILNTSDLRLRNNSNITTNATGEATGGNIEINTDNLIAIEDSDISANAQAAFGGQVIINADAIFGTQFRQQQTGASDITATSELGADFSGTVELNSEIDPAQGLVDLPQSVVDPAALIAQDPCRQRGDSQFIITGRGGIAPDPTQALSAIQGLVEWESLLIEPVTSQPNHSSQRRQQQSRNRDNNLDDYPVDSRTIVPARGWIRTEDGEVILVGYDPTKTGVQRQPNNPHTCQPSK